MQLAAILRGQWPSGTGMWLNSLQYRQSPAKPKSVDVKNSFVCVSFYSCENPTITWQNILGLITLCLPESMGW